MEPNTLEARDGDGDENRAFNLLAGAAEPKSDDEGAFLSCALDDILHMLRANYVHLMGEDGADEAVYDMFDTVGVRDIEIVRMGGAYSDPHVRVWLADTPPAWAGVAESRKIRYSTHREHYNGRKAHYVADVREM